MQITTDQQNDNVILNEGARVNTYVFMPRNNAVFNLRMFIVNKIQTES